MATIIVQGADVIAPSIVLGIMPGRESQNLVHPIIGRAEPDVTLRPANLRTGSIEMGFAGPTAEADSYAAEMLHAAGGIFTVISDERSTLGLSYVTTGRIVRELEDATRDGWILRVEFQEVAAP